MAKVNLKKARSNPGSRSKLKDSQLTPAQLRERKRLQAIKKVNADPLYNPSAILQGTSLKNAAQALADAEVDPKVRAYDSQIANTRTQNTALLGQAGSLAQQQQGQDAQTVARTAALQQMLNQGLAGVGQKAQEDVAGLRTAQNAATLQDVTQRGGGLQGTNTTDAELAAQQARVAAQSGAAQSLGMQQGATWTALASAMQQAGGLRAGETQQKLGILGANAVNDLNTKRADAEASRGGLFANYLAGPNGLRQTSFENNAAAQTLNLRATDAINDVKIKKAQIRQTAKDKALQRRIAREKSAASNSLAAGRLEESKRHNREAERLAAQRLANQKKGTPAGTGPDGKPVKPATPQQRNTANSKIQYALTVARDAKKTRAPRSQVAHALVNGTPSSKEAGQGVNKVDQLYASVALDVAYDGHVSRTNAAKLHAMGVTLKELGLPSYASTTKGSKNALDKVVRDVRKNKLRKPA